MAATLNSCQAALRVGWAHPRGGAPSSPARRPSAAPPPPSPSPLPPCRGLAAAAAAATARTPAARTLPQRAGTAARHPQRVSSGRKEVSQLLRIDRSFDASDWIGRKSGRKSGRNVGKRNDCVWLSHQIINGQDTAQPERGSGLRHAGIARERDLAHALCRPREITP